MLKFQIGSVLLLLCLIIVQILDGQQIKYLKSVFAWTRNGWHHVKNPYICPSTHRFAFAMGTKCCRHNLEEIRSDSDKLSAEISEELSSILEGEPGDDESYYGYDDGATYGDNYEQTKKLIGSSRCEGGTIFFDSDCCLNDDFVMCTHPNYTMAERPFSCIDGRVCMTLSNQTCVFPFKYYGHLFSHCIGESGQNSGWCATDVAIKTREYTSYGYCKPGCTSEEWS